MKIIATISRFAICLLTTSLAAGTTMAQVPASAPASVAQSEADAAFARWDKNNDKSLSVAEFSAGWPEIQAANTLRTLHANFVAKDADKNGSLGPSEYLRLELVQKAGTSAPPMATFDTDKNQSLDFKEYVGLVGALVKPKP